MNICQKRPFAWKTARVSKSPFKTMKAAKKASAAYAANQPIGFTATASLKAMGRIPRSDGCYKLGPKYSGNGFF